VGIGAGGPHIADENWELDCGCDLVFWSAILERGADSRGVDLGSMCFPKVLTSVHFSAYLVRCIASLLKPSTGRVGIYPA
jgi:hypothetical protein